MVDMKNKGCAWDFLLFVEKVTCEIYTLKTRAIHTGTRYVQDILSTIHCLCCVSGLVWPGLVWSGLRPLSLSLSLSLFCKQVYVVDMKNKGYAWDFLLLMKTVIIFQKRHWREKSFKKRKKKGHFPHIGNEIKICSQNKCHHHLSNVRENSFRMFLINWVISDYQLFVWAVC